MPLSVVGQTAEMLVQLLCLLIGSPPSDAAAQQASATQCSEAIRRANHTAVDRFSQPLAIILPDVPRQDTKLET
jgi:hypothetical protein